MRNLLLTALILSAPVASFAANDAGCFDPFGANKNNKVSQSIMVTGNASSYSSTTSAMTSHTSGCNVSGLVRQDKEAGVFVAQHVDELKSELAIGQGEHLAAFEDLMGCQGRTSVMKASLRSPSSPVMTRDFSDGHVNQWIESLRSQCTI